APPLVPPLPLHGALPISALFRHPLGLPIPHTAIVPTRKNEIGRALARFIRDHFLTREAIAGRLERADLVGRIGAWLEKERNARLDRKSTRLNSSHVKISY